MNNEFDIHDLILRMEAMERIDLPQRLGYIEHQLKNFSMACHSLDKKFQQGIKISVDKEALEIIEPIKSIIGKLASEVRLLLELRKDLEENLKNMTVQGTLKFMAKELHELTQHVHSIKEEGVKKDLHLALTLDGYEMVRKKPSAVSGIQDSSKEVDPEECIADLFATLEDREVKVLMSRYGLLGEKRKTLESTGKMLGISRERIRAIQHKALVKCRHPSRRKLVERVTNLELRKAILGNN